MVFPGSILRILFLFLLALGGFAAVAQPTLPNIQGTVQGRVVALSWTNPYNSIKKISIMRSADSVSEYTMIGTIKKPEMGAEEFTDPHPLPGNNYYKLAIVFNSGVSWSSNPCRAYLERSEMDVQHATRPVAVVPPLTDHAQPPVPNNQPAIDTLAGKREVLQLPAGQPLAVAAPDTVRIKPPAPAPIEITHHPKVNIAFDDPNAAPATFIKSAYIFVDTLSGHVDMSLPDDVATHHYSIKFYDAEDHMIFEVPRLHHSKIIFDRRNFQHRGVYRFVLRRDVVELESGYVQVK